MPESGLFYEILYNVLTICFPIGVICFIKGMIKENRTFIFIGIVFWCIYLYAGIKVLQSDGFYWVSFPAYIITAMYIDRKLIKALNKEEQGRCNNYG